MRHEDRALRFDEKSFLITVLGFSPYCDYKTGNEYYSEKNKTLNVTDKNHLKCDVINGSVQNGLRQPILFSFVLDKPSG